VQSLRIFSILAWTAIPTVYYGGCPLLGMINRGEISEFAQTCFRAGLAYSGVLLLMALLNRRYMDKTRLSQGVKVGILAQSSGFFLHIFTRQPGASFPGTTLTVVGALLLAAAVLVLVYGLIVSREVTERAP
jgi:hypothetical protein